MGQKVKTDDVITVHYTGKFEDGNVFDSSLDREPLEFKVGEGKIIPGFEEAVIGMAEGESKEIEIPSEKAYGDVREDLVEEINKSNLPESIDPKEGMELVSKNPEGQELIVKIKEVKDDTIVIDANHPLAGQNLFFDIRVEQIV
jgi:FKBP-type peptidyl-prolyl cis-trans isomerase 2